MNDISRIIFILFSSFIFSWYFTLWKSLSSMSKIFSASCTILTFTYRLKTSSLYVLINVADFLEKLIKIVLIDSASGFVAFDRNSESSSISWADLEQKFLINSVWKSS